MMMMMLPLFVDVVFSTHLSKCGQHESKEKSVCANVLEDRYLPMMKTGNS